MLVSIRLHSGSRIIIFARSAMLRACVCGQSARTQGQLVHSRMISRNARSTKPKRCCFSPCWNWWRSFGTRYGHGSSPPGTVASRRLARPEDRPGMRNWERLPVATKKIAAIGRRPGPQGGGRILKAPKTSRLACNSRRLQQDHPRPLEGGLCDSAHKEIGIPSKLKN